MNEWQEKLAKTLAELGKIELASMELLRHIEHLRTPHHKAAFAQAIGNIYAERVRAALHVQDMQEIENRLQREEDERKAK